MECVCILLGKEPTWAVAKLVLTDTSLLQTLINYEKDCIPPRIVKLITKYYDDKDFVPEVPLALTLALTRTRS